MSATREAKVPAAEVQFPGEPRAVLNCIAYHSGAVWLHGMLAHKYAHKPARADYHNHMREQHRERIAVLRTYTMENRY